MGNELDACRQLLVVISDSWDDLTARMFRFEKKGPAWVTVNGQFEAVLGNRGMAWGIGLHEKSGDGPIKKEGDRRAPAGIFALIKAMGYDAMPPVGTAFPYEQIQEKAHCVDDSASRFYNKIVNETDLKAPAATLWKSSESMKRKDCLYKRLIVVDHNMKEPKPGAGSCIFIHVWQSKEHGTAGCTAMEEKNVVELMTWMDRKMGPLLVQLPQSEYIRVWKDWGLPHPELLG